MKLGLTLPSFVEDPEIPLAVARAADAAGIDGVFVYDHLWRDRPPPRRPALEGFALLGAVAAETRRVAIGTLVARATLRPPAVLAHGFDTAQRISGGRLIAGIGSGDKQSREENEAFGLEFGNMAMRIEALHDAVRAALGRGYPVWVGGHAVQVREIVPLADAWNSWGRDAERFAEEAALVHAIAPTAELTWGGLVVLARTDAEARDKAQARNASKDVIVGSPATVAAALRDYEAVGATWAVLGPLDSSNPENAELIADVADALRE